MQRVETTSRGPVTVVGVSGPLTDETTDQARSQALRAIEQSVGRVVIDASGVPYADSQGIEMLLDAADSLDAIGQSLRLASVGETLREILELTGVAGRMEFYEDVTQAVRSLA
ncbi:MAG: STAS domain-containing protein [Phycisphaerales bacterium JB040]